MALNLYPARRPGEDPIEYRERRRAGNRAVQNYLRGRLAFIASEPVQLTVIGVDPQVDEAVRRGLYTDLKTHTLKDGTRVRIGRTKGETFRHPDRKAARAAKLAESRAARC